MIWSNGKKLKAVLISSTTKKRFKSIFLFLIGYKEIRANVLFIWKSFTHFFLYKTVAKFYLDILILIREKDIENIFEKFKNEIWKALPDVGTKYTVMLCFIEIILLSLFHIGSFIPNNY